MAPEQSRAIADDYARIEAAQNKLPRGADSDKILSILLAKYSPAGLTLADIRRAVLDNVFSKPI